MKISEAKPRYLKPQAAAAGKRKSVAGPTDRVTVRLKPALAAMLAEVRRKQGLSVTQIVEEALEKHLMAATRRPKLSLLEAFEKHGLLGSVDMPADASVNYKQYVGEYLDRKHGHR